MVHSFNLIHGKVQLIFIKDFSVDTKKFSSFGKLKEKYNSMRIKWKTMKKRFCKSLRALGMRIFSVLFHWIYFIISMCVRYSRTQWAIQNFIVIHNELHGLLHYRNSIQIHGYNRNLEIENY